MLIITDRNDHSLKGNIKKMFITVATYPKSAHNISSGWKLLETLFLLSSDFLTTLNQHLDGTHMGVRRASKLSGSTAFLKT